MLNGKRHLLPLFGAPNLKRRGRADGGVKSDVGGIPFGGAGLHIASALALGVRTRAPPGVAAHHLIQGGIQAAGVKHLARFYFLAAVPPISVAVVERVLFRRLNPPLFTQFLFLTVA